jgi:hypothetical protein
MALLIKSVRATGALGVVGVFVPQDPKSLLISANFGVKACAWEPVSPT